MKFALFLSALLLVSSSVQAQEFPAKPITMVVPFAAGTITDNGARVLAQRMSESLGQSVIVDNKPGAAGVIGATAVASSRPDGYTILYATSGPMATNPYIYKDLSYDPLKSFTFIYPLGDAPLIMVANPEAPFRTVEEFVAYAKKNPGKINYGSQGAGTSTHLVAELFQQEAGIQLTHIPYKAGGPLIADLLSGRLDAAFDFASVVRPLIEPGKLQGLAVTGPHRLKVLADVPTLTELGYPVVLTAWATFAAPSGIPQSALDKLTAASAQAVKHPDVLNYFRINGTTLLPEMTGDRLKAFVGAENQKFKALVERSGLTPQ
jgi:tripartite-type tricarboxylate transporter receptor subunit TctC